MNTFESRPVDSRETDRQPAWEPTGPMLEIGMWMVRVLRGDYDQEGEHARRDSRKGLH